jgi:excinuclease ABC subunit A
VPDRADAAQGAVAPWAKTGNTSPYYTQTLEPSPPLRLHQHDQAWKDLPAEGAEAILLHGTGEEQDRRFTYDDGCAATRPTKPFEGVIGNIERRWRETDSQWVREELSRFQSEPALRGLRRQPPEARGAGGQDRRHAYRRRPPSFRSARRATGSIRCRRRSRQAERDRPRILKEIRDRLASSTMSASNTSRCRAILRHAVGRRKPAHPACLADRLRPDRRALRAR